MPLDPQIEKLLQFFANTGEPPLISFNPVAAREMANRTRGKSLRPEPVAQVSDRAIPGLGGDIPIRIYSPASSTPLPLLVYFHGGGWVLGNLDWCDPICRSLANQVNCIVVSADYRLAPEHKFPAAVEDAYVVAEWVAANAEKLNGDRDRLAVAGDSAGGNLAAAVALIARDRSAFNLICQVLIYPVTEYSLNTPSYQEFGTGDFGLSTEEMRWFWHHYLASPEDGKNPYASPLLADLTNLPPAFILTAECDPLRDEAEIYAEKLQAAGVKVKCQRYAGMIHGFVGWMAAVEAGKSAIADIADWLRSLI